MIVGNQDIAEKYKKGTAISLAIAPITVPIIIGATIR
jgi:hypothetical protein